MKKLWFWAGNIGFVVSAYYGLFCGVKGCENIMRFMAWFSFCVVLPCAMVKDVAAQMREEGRSGPVYVATTADIAVTFMLAYAGWFWTAAAVLITAILERDIFKKEAQ